MTFLRENLGLSVIALLVPVMLIPVTALAVATGITIGVVALLTLARWVRQDASPGSQNQGLRPPTPY